MPRHPRGVFIPIVTPFLDGKIDEESYGRLVEHCIAHGIDGIVPAATTGESPTIEDDEYLRILEATTELVRGRIAIYAGISNNSTQKAIRTIRKVDGYGINGYLVTAPSFNLPSQEGIFNHFTAISDATARDVLIYNIPYRTGRNVENETVLKLSRRANIIGIKDSGGNIGQTIELIREKPKDFSVLTGEDVLFYFNLVCGGDGGILASAHLATEVFIDVFTKVEANDHRAALASWNRMSRVIPLLFSEPNPGPLKYVLARKKLIRSDEVRAPLAGISDGLKATLDELIEKQVI